jgi:hypothetical protein
MKKLTVESQAQLVRKDRFLALFDEKELNHPL